MSAEVELLRAAARVMRERANAASEGPWETGGDGLVWPPRMGDPVSASTEPEDGEHIASWHPAVALAVAEWLEFTAERAALAGELGLPYNAVASRAVAVARAYLGRQP